MCGRFINLTGINSIKKIFNIDSSLNFNLLSFNISPSQNCHIIFKKNDLKIDVAKWGYIFNDSKTNQEKNAINSRLETIANKILFKESYYERKCIIPLNGYFEWSIKDNKKTPFFIHLPPSEPMYLAGIWKYNDYKINTHKVFTVITKNANKHIGEIHHRMPIVLSRYEAEEFLYDDNSSLLSKSFTSSIESELDFFPVSKFVNNPLNNSKECIEPI